MVQSSEQLSHISVSQAFEKTVARMKMTKEIFVTSANCVRTLRNEPYYPPLLYLVSSITLRVPIC